MLPVQLSYGNEGFKEIQEFLEQNYHKDYTLSTLSRYRDSVDYTDVLTIPTF